MIHPPLLPNEDIKHRIKMQNCLTRKVTELFKAFTLHGPCFQSKFWENFLASSFIPKCYVLRAICISYIKSNGNAD